MKHTTLAVMTAAFLASGCSTLGSGSNPLKNSSFESEWSGWTEAGPDGDGTSISEDARSGSKSAKITNENGRFEQVVPILPDSGYELVAYVQGAGVIGMQVGEESVTAASEGSGDDWSKVTLPIKSGSNTTVLVFGEYGGDEGRFDDFELDAVSGPALAPPE